MTAFRNWAEDSCCYECFVLRIKLGENRRRQNLSICFNFHSYWCNISWQESSTLNDSQSQLINHCLSKMCWLMMSFLKAKKEKSEFISLLYRNEENHKIIYVCEQFLRRFYLTQGFNTKISLCSFRKLHDCCKFRLSSIAKNLCVHSVSMMIF